MSTFKVIRATPNCRFYQPDFAVGFDRCTMETGEAIEAQNLSQTHIVFVRSGLVGADFNDYKSIPARAGQLLFFPRSSDCRLQALEPSEIIILCYNNELKVCTKLMLEQLEPLLEEFEFEFRPLDACVPIRMAMETVGVYVDDQVDCACLYEMKQQEIIIIFNHYYTQQEKLMFFYPAIGKDIDFRSRVLSNYMNVRTAEELARVCGYGLKNFHRIFQGQFGMPPYHWMQLQWAGHIRGKLLDPRIPIKAIVVEYGFSSQAHLNSYCKRFLGATPAQIRHASLKEQLVDAHS